MSEQVSNLERRDGRWKRREKAVFTYSLAWDPVSATASELYPRSGEVVRIIRLMSDPKILKELPTFAERQEAGEDVVYRVKFPDGHVNDAFEDELVEP